MAREAIGGMCAAHFRLAGAKSYCWDEWPDEERPESLRGIPECGIDVIGVRSDGHLIAMQCKSRQLDRDGHGADIHKAESNKFISASHDDKVWKELFLITNGDVKMASTLEAYVGGSRPIKLINLAVDLIRQKEMLASQQYEPEPSPSPDRPHSFQSRNDMQKEAIEISLIALKKQEKINGVARGRIILPCGSGKTRIALRLIEKLTPKGEVSVVLCPSIALVSQIRREFIYHTKENMDVLAVCSDKDAGKEEGKHDPTADVGFVKVSQVKGNVTTNSEEIAKWIDEVNQEHIGVIFGTYQSAYRISEALVGERRADGTIRQFGGKNRKVSCLIADEAHRTSGIRKIAHKEEKLRNFTICHNQEKFPVTYRIYQTATPKVFNVNENAKKIDESKLMIRSMDDPNTFGVELYRRSYKDAVQNKWLSDYRIIALGINDEESFNVAQQIAQDDKNTKLTTGSLLKGLPLALVMGGATTDKTGTIQSSISFIIPSPNQNK
ncbi:MAG: DEAD/DEAH box helicase family protein [Aestuariivita sp.]|nr:DEAD/DEAH box helicase family protein [Aestuariivita sp.]